MFRHCPFRLCKTEEQIPQLCGELAKQKKMVVCLSGFIAQKNLVTTTLPFFCRTSCVRHALLTTNRVKHLILVGAMLFKMFLQIFEDSPCVTLLSFLYILFTEKMPSSDVSISMYQIEQQCQGNSPLHTKELSTYLSPSHIDVF